MSGWLIPDWKKAPKFLSVQFALAGAVVSGLWVALPAFQGILPPAYFAASCVGCSVIAIVLRLINQEISGDPDGIPRRL